MSNDIYSLDAMARAYVECAAWCSADSSAVTEDNRDGMIDRIPDWREKLAPSVIEHAAKVCAEFALAQEDWLGDWLPDQRGHDLWLTRNWHGSGFWDRPWGTYEARENLTRASHALGEVNLYLGDDGMIYIA